MKKMKAIGSIALLLLLLLGPEASAFAAATARAQEVFGNIEGTVKDSSGAVIPDVAVVAKSTQRSYSVTTDDAGAYRFNNLLPGLYTVTVSGTGFGAVKRDAISVEIGRTLQVNFEMNPVAAGESVTITASDQPIVDVTSTKTATNITEQKIDVLPKNLNFTSVLEVAPGTRKEDRTGGFQVDGASASENVFIIDGVEVTNILGGTLGGKDSEASKNIPLDFVKEVQVKSAGYEAEFGGATGGVFNVVTKSGTNDYHGEFRLEYESSRFRGDDAPTLRFDPLDLSQQTIEYFDNPRGKDKRRLLNPVVSIGGPIVKDKLWFFTSYAPQFFRQRRFIDLIQDPNITVANGGNSVVTLDANEVTYKQKSDYFIGRLDYSPTSKLSLYGSFINSPVKTEGPSDVDLGGISLLQRQTSSINEFRGNIAGEPSLYPLQGGYTPSWQAAGGAIWNITDKIIFSFRGGHTYLNDKAGSYGLPTDRALFIINAGRACSSTVTVPAGLSCNPNTTSAGFPTGLTVQTIATKDITTRTNLNFDGTFIARFLGQQHIFKGGYQVNRLANDVDRSFLGGARLTFLFGASRPDQFTGENRRGSYGYYIVDDVQTRGKVNSTNQGLFIQDSWQVHPRLTLNLGLRSEKEFLPAFPLIPEFHPGLSAEQLAGASTKPIDFGWGDKLAPRFGGAWDVFGNGKLKISGSFSLFYDTMKYEIARGSFGGEKFIRTRRELNTSDIFGFNVNNTPGAIITGPSDLRFPSNLAGEDNGIDPDLKPYREREYTGSVDYALNNNLVLSARLTRKKLDRAIEDIGFSDSTGTEFFTIGNPGFGLTASNVPPTPKATRKYTGLEIRLDKRFSNNWYANLSYVYSKLRGNYSGLSNSDEVSTVTGLGRTDPNVSRNFDLPFLNFDTFGNIVEGVLPTDRPSTFKAFAAYRFNYTGLGKGMSTEIGGSQFIYQGTPVTTSVNAFVDGSSANAFVLGRGDAGRLNVFTQTDLIVTHYINVSERVRLRFSANVLNLFNERNETDRWTTLTAPGVTIAYNDLQDYLTSQGDFRSRPGFAEDPRFNKSSFFQTPIRARFAFGVQF